MPQPRNLVYNPAANTVTIVGASRNAPWAPDLFDLRGARAAPVTVPANRAMSLDLTYVPNGTVIARANGEVVRVGGR